MAENESDLYRIIKHCSEGNLGKNRFIVRVQVLSIAKCFVDSTNRSILNRIDTSYLYDIHVTDGLSILKILLDPSLSHFIETNRLNVKSVCQVTLEERCVCLKPCLVIVALQVLRTTAELICKGPMKYRLAFLDDRSEVSQEGLEFPLTGLRHYYLDAWNDAFPEYPLINSEDYSCTEEPIPPSIEYLLIASRKFSLDNLHEFRPRHGFGRDKSVLLVRVVGISKLQNSGRVTDNKKCPFWGLYVVTDGTALCYLSIWDTLIVAFYDKIEIGSYLIIQECQFSPVVPGRLTRFRIHLHGRKELPPMSHLELKLNPAKPGSKTKRCFYLLNATDNCGFNEMPIPGFSFFKPCETAPAVMNSIFDIVGIVVAMSRYERIVKQDPVTKRKNGYWVLRWLELIGCNGESLKLEVFVNGQPQRHRELCIGQMLIVSNMRFIKVEKEKVEYFTSTNETQLIIITDENAVRFGWLQEFSKLKKMIDSGDIKKQIANASGIGGMYLYPPAPSNLQDRRSTLEFSACDRWFPIVRHLQLWESRYMVIDGCVAAVTFVDVGMDVRLYHEPSAYQRTPLYSDSTINLDDYTVLGIEKPHSNTFPHKFNRHNNAQQRPLQFPKTSFPSAVLCSRVINLKDIDFDEDFLNMEINDYQCEGYYEIVLVGDKEEAVALRCIFVPTPAQLPVPNFKSLLMRQFHARTPEDGHRPKYSWAEFDKCLQTVDEFAAGNRRGKFYLELFKHPGFDCEIILHRMYKEPSFSDQSYYCTVKI